MFINFSKQQKDQMLSDIQRFFYEERDEEIGSLAAENVLEFFKKHLGPHFYNEGIRDSKKMMDEKLATLEEDFYLLERPVK